MTAITQFDIAVAEEIYRDFRRNLFSSAYLAAAKHRERESDALKVIELQKTIADLQQQLEKAATTAYRVCAETRHVSLGQKVENAILEKIDWETPSDTSYRDHQVKLRDAGWTAYNSDYVDEFPRW